MEINWELIFQIVGITGAITVPLLGAVAWTIKKLGTHALDRGLKKYEAELNQKSDTYKLGLEKQLEAHKLELDKQLETHKADLGVLMAKQDKLQHRRLEIMSELYKRIVKLDMRMNELTAFMKAVIKDAEEEENTRIRETGDAYNDFLLYFVEHKIFFSEETIESLENLRKHYLDCYMDYTFKYRFNIASYEFSAEQFEKISKTVRELIPPILSKIEDEFRDLAGVYD